MSDDDDPWHGYAGPIGSAILALNRLESNVFYLLQMLDAAPLDLEAKFFIDKIRQLEKVACLQSDGKIRSRMERIALEARRLADDRNNFAHGVLWTDAFTGEHRLSFVRRRDRKRIEDARPPAVIDRTALDLVDLAADVGDLAMEVGGLERWEEYMRSLDI